jgi:hypothetical protein
MEQAVIDQARTLVGKKRKCARPLTWNFTICVQEDQTVYEL